MISPFFNVARFALLYAISMSIAGIDLALTVRTGFHLTGSSLGGTASYVMIGAGTILGARFGGRLFQGLGVRNTFAVSGACCMTSGILTACGSGLQVPALFYVGLLFVGVFIGLSNYHRLLVVDFSPRPSAWDTGLVLFAGVIGAVAGPLLADTLASGPEESFRAYIAVSALGLAAVAGSVILPGSTPPRLSSPGPETGADADADAGAEAGAEDPAVPLGEAPDDSGRLRAGAVIGFFSYLIMTVIMTVVPLQAQVDGMDGGGIAVLSQVHLTSMYLPILLASLLLSRLRPIAVSAVSFAVASGLLLLIHLGHDGDGTGFAALLQLMIVSGLLWAFAYTAGSTMVAGSAFGRAHPAARGRAEILPPLGLITGSVSGGFLLESADFHRVVLMTLVVCLVAAVGCAAVRLRPRSTRAA